MAETTDIYFDFEFIDDGREIIPISLGMCARTWAAYSGPAIAFGGSSPGELYLEYQFDTARANDWVRENVFPHLELGEMRGVNGESRPHAALLIKEWVKRVCGDTNPRIWGYYPSYDWVLLCQHFGTMMQLPKGWPMRPECLKQSANEAGLGRDRFPKQENAHHALADARWIRSLHEAILEYES